VGLKAEMEFLEECKEGWKQSLGHAAEMLQKINHRLAVLRREAARADRLADALAGDTECTGLARVEE
jgi:hypothetical protein